MSHEYGVVMIIWRLLSALCFSILKMMMTMPGRFRRFPCDSFRPSTFAAFGRIHPTSLFTHPSRVGDGISETAGDTMMQFYMAVRIFIAFPTSPTPSKSSKRFGSWNVFSAAPSQPRSLAAEKFIPPPSLAGRRRNLANA